MYKKSTLFKEHTSKHCSLLKLYMCIISPFYLGHLDRGADPAPTPIGWLRVLLGSPGPAVDAMPLNPCKEKNNINSMMISEVSEILMSDGGVMHFQYVTVILNEN